MNSLGFLFLGLLVGVAVGVLAGGRVARNASARDEQRVRESFAALSQEALHQASASFLDLARTSLSEQNAVAAGDLELRKQAVDAMVGPLRQQLDQVTRSLSELEANRQGAYAGLIEQV